MISLKANSDVTSKLPRTKSTKTLDTISKTKKKCLTITSNDVDDDKVYSTKTVSPQSSKNSTLNSHNDDKLSSGHDLQSSKTASKSSQQSGVKKKKKKIDETCIDGVVFSAFKTWEDLQDDTNKKMTLKSDDCAKIFSGPPEKQLGFNATESNNIESNLSYSANQDNSMNSITANKGYEKEKHLKKAKNGAQDLTNDEVSQHSNKKLKPSSITLKEALEAKELAEKKLSIVQRKLEEERNRNKEYELHRSNQPHSQPKLCRTKAPPHQTMHPTNPYETGLGGDSTPQINPPVFPQMNHHQQAPPMPSFNAYASQISNQANSMGSLGMGALPPPLPQSYGAPYIINETTISRQTSIIPPSIPNTLDHAATSGRGFGHHPSLYINPYTSSPPASLMAMQQHSQPTFNPSITERSFMEYARNYSGLASQIQDHPNLLQSAAASSHPALPCPLPSLSVNPFSLDRWSRSAVDQQLSFNRYSSFYPNSSMPQAPNKSSFTGTPRLPRTFSSGLFSPF